MTTHVQAATVTAEWDEDGFIVRVETEDGDGYRIRVPQPLLAGFHDQVVGQLDDEWISAARRGATDCPRCHGDGVVQFNPSRNQDPQCVDDARCPDCHGTGLIESGRA